MNFHKINFKQNGFTLIETLIYITIIGMVVVSFVTFSISISNSKNKTYVTQEVQANARLALNLISQQIRGATGINIESSSFGVDPGILSLSLADGANDPTIIELDQDDGRLQITQGLNNPIIFTSQQAKITNLVFTNLTPIGSNRENIRIEMTIEYNNSTSDLNFTSSQSLRTAVSVRQ